MTAVRGRGGLYHIMIENGRKTHCLKSDALQGATRHALAWLKSEEIPEDSWHSLYVDLGYIEQLDNNANHLISGRRGTGKTHLLQAFKKHIDQKKSSEIAIISSILNLSMKETPITSSIQDQKDAYSAAKNLFNQMLRYMFEQFLAEVSPYRDRLIGDSRNRVDNLLQDLLIEIELGTPAPNKDLIDEKYAKRNAGNGLEGNFSVKGKAIHDENVRIIAEKPNVKNHNSEYSEIYYTGNVEHQRVRSLIQEVLKECKISILHLLIDEWMELDKNTPSYIQNYFAQFLKNVFFNCDNISVVIASIWNQTSLYERADMAVSQGLQIGHDIFHTVDLDTSLLDSEIQIEEFCEKLLFRRLSKEIPELNDFIGRDGVISDAFVTDIFDDRRNFRSYVAASHGIPRDIMKIFGLGTRLIKADFATKCINYNVVMEVAQRIYRREKRDTIQNGTPTKVMWKKINDLMSETNSRLFIIKDGDQKTSSSFRALIDHELIHEIPSAVLPRWVRSEHKAYFIDYGNFVDWKKSKSVPLDEMIQESILPSWEGIDESDLNRFLIKVIHDYDLYISCADCKFLNDRSNKVVQLFNICLNCAKSLTDIA